MLLIGDTHKNKDRERLKAKGQKKIEHANSNFKKAGITTNIKNNRL